MARDSGEDCIDSAFLGENDIEIEIWKTREIPVTEATIFVNHYIPPMPRIVVGNFMIDAKLKGTKYKATMNFIKSGPWIIAIKINHAGKTSTAKFNVDAQ